jgi:tetratricopeptide (TPR) repeat protein
MTQDIGEVCNEVVRHISENGSSRAKKYCRDSVESDIDPNSEGYRDLKSEAIDETEVWGSESKKWLRLAPAAAQEEETDSEWRFVIGNLLISAVMECETSGDLTDDALIAKAAHEMFQELHKSKRHEMLSLALYHHKMGHVMVVQEDDYESAVDHFDTALEIIEDHNSLGNWHHNALVLRDNIKTKAKYYEDKGDLLEAVRLLEERSKEIQTMDSPSAQKFYKQMKAEEHRIRAEMAKEIDNLQSRRKHLRKCSKLYNESGKSDLADKYSRMEMEVSG